MKTRIYVTILVVVLYLVAKYFIPTVYMIFSPIAIIVSFLHETGHALFALLSGGKVDLIQISEEFGGLAFTRGGVRWLVLTGGYIGSAIFGNLLLSAGIFGNNWSRAIGIMLSVGLVLIALFWINDNLSRMILISSGIVLFFLTWKFKNITYNLLTIIGILALVYIIEDFRIGPGSDLQKFTAEVSVFNQTIWMYLWLIIVVGITGLNIWGMLCFNSNKPEIRSKS